MVKIRLMRLGAKKDPHYRLVVVDGRKKRSGDYIESLGYFNPRRTVEEPLKIDTERAKHWLSQGAQPTDTAIKLLEQVGVELPNVKRKRARAYRARHEASSEA
jgi:small subunit ribosomal protein S16